MLKHIAFSVTDETCQPCETRRRSGSDTPTRWQSNDRGSRQGRLQTSGDLDPRKQRTTAQKEVRKPKDVVLQKSVTSNQRHPPSNKLFVFSSRHVPAARKTESSDGSITTGVRLEQIASTKL